VTRSSTALPIASDDPVAAFQALRQIYAGYGVARSVHVIAELGVADALDDSPLTAAELASRVGAHADSLDRLLRLVSSHGVFTSEGGRYGHSAASRLLRSDHPQSVRPLARMFGLALNWAAYGALMHSAKTGRSALEVILPEGFWKYFEAHPQESEIFNAAMAAKARVQVAAIVQTYDFSRAKRIGDIGGGRGHLLQAILTSAPQARGVLFDLPHVTEDAKGIASDRLELHPGDFFRDVLPECDLYVVMEIIHDWPDAESQQILESIRRAAPKGATLLLLEEIVPEDPGPHWAKVLDVHMLTLLGGKQRTLAEYETLLQAAGFKLRREMPTPVGISIVEAEAV